MYEEISKEKVLTEKNSFLHPRNLEDFMSSSQFFEKIKASLLDITHGELFIIILKYSVNNSLSFSAKVNLFKLINSLFNAHILPFTEYTLDKITNAQGGAHFHAICYKCNTYLGEHGSMAHTDVCPECKSKVSTATPSANNFFVTIDPSEQISDLLSMYDEHYDNVTKSRSYESNYLNDVYDGKEYRKFVKSLPEEDKSCYVTAVFNTDGANRFKCSQSSIWPIFLEINELPQQVRLNKPVLCGLWINKKKPDMSVYLDKFVDIINKLTIEGFECTIKNEKRRLKLYVLQCIVDTLARNDVQFFRQFNAYQSCSWCLYIGVYYEGSMRFPYRLENLHSRTHEETVETMLRVAITNQVELGVTGPSPLINLTKFDIIKGFGPDRLHFMCVGIAKDFAGYFENLLSIADVQAIDEIMANLSVPKQINRLSRPFSSKVDWKAREWENFILYYSVPVLSPFLPVANVKHWLLLVESYYILLQDKIHIDDLNKANRMLEEFVASTEELYGLQAMTYNIHQCLHVCEYVLNWGPLWSNSTFAFESANFYILRAIKAANGPTLQIVRYVNMNHSLMKLEDFYKQKNGEGALWFTEYVLTKKIQSVYKRNNIWYFGRGKKSNDLFRQINVNQKAKIFYKIVKNNCLYDSALIKKCRSNNSFAKLKNGKYIKIFGFVIDDDEQDTTICRIVSTEKFFFDNEHLQIIKGEGELTRILTSDIDRVCVFIRANNHYLCAVPNLIHY